MNCNKCGQMFLDNCDKCGQMFPDELHELISLKGSHTVPGQYSQPTLSLDSTVSPH